MEQVVKQFTEMDQIATCLSISPSNYLVAIGTEDCLVKVGEERECVQPEQARE